MEKNVETARERAERIYKGLLAGHAGGAKIRTSPDYTSHVVRIFDDDTVKLIVYKDWDKYHRRWDYHCKPLGSLAFTIALYAQMYNGEYGEGKEIQ